MNAPQTIKDPINWFLIYVTNEYEVAAFIRHYCNIHLATETWVTKFDDGHAVYVDKDQWVMKQDEEQQFFNILCDAIQDAYISGMNR